MPSRKSGIGSLGKEPRKYYNHNYVEVIRGLTPDLYADTDYAIYGTQEDILYTVLGKLLKTMDEISDIVPVDSSTEDLQRRFVMRNNLTHIRPSIFENKILKADGKSFKDFGNKADFKKYLELHLLPQITTNSPNLRFVQGVARKVDSSVSSAAACKDFLLDTLSWAYILNYEAGEVSPSSIVATQLSELYDNKIITEKEGIFMLYEYLWKNRDFHPSYLNYLPTQFSVNATDADKKFFTSGTQQLDNLKTVLGVWYNPHDESSTTLDDYFELYTNTQGLSPEKRFTPRQIEGGAITKFLQAISLGFYDVNTTISELEDLVDLERCPPEFLQYLASLIGWKLLTADVDRWRAQLRKAVYLYKSKGTKRCLTDAINLVLPGISTSISDNLTENWELYLPRMIYYLIATASPVLNDGNYTAHTLDGIPVDQYFPDNMDNNYRVAVDYVLSAVHSLTPPTNTTPEGGAIYINKNKFALNTWDPTDVDFPGFLHRGKPNVKVPPWEDDRFYSNTFVTRAQMVIICDILTGQRKDSTSNVPGGGFEIPIEYASSLSSIVLKDNIEDPVYEYHWNMGWKSYSKTLQVPPNLSALKEAKDLKSLGMMDSWCSKSSFIFSHLELDDLNHKVEGVSLSLDNILTNISSVFTNFIPFHVVFKLIAETTFDDHHESADRFCVAVARDLYDLSTGGDSDQSILNNFNPSSLTLFQDGSVNTHGTSPRTSGRRRNLKYNLEYKTFSRNGRSMPLPEVYPTVGGSEPSSVSSLEVNSVQFIPLGYNFSSGRYFSTTGTVSGVYDASNDLGMSSLECQYIGNNTRPGTEYYLPYCRRGKTDVSSVFPASYGIAVSSTFPCRAPASIGCDTTVLRDNLSNISELIIGKLIRLGQTDDFGKDTLNNFAFGSNIHRDFIDSSGLYASSTYVSSTSDKINYTEKEVKIIYSYFNELRTGKQSRNAYTTSSIYQENGGSRDAYIDNYGGDTYGTNDVLYSAGSGTLYELEDD